MAVSESIYFTKSALSGEQQHDALFVRRLVCVSLCLSAWPFAMHAGDTQFICIISNDWWFENQVRPHVISVLDILFRQAWPIAYVSAWLLSVLNRCVALRYIRLPGGMHTHTISMLLIYSRYRRQIKGITAVSLINIPLWLGHAYNMHYTFVSDSCLCLCLSRCVCG